MRGRREMRDGNAGTDGTGTIVFSRCGNGRVAQASDLAVASNKVGAPSFAQFAKGGSPKCSRR
jgi:hypothetical protein